MMLPLVPVTIKLYVPVGVDPVVVIFRAEDPELLMDDGVNVAVAPAGKPFTLNVTGEMSVLSTLKFTVTLALAFWFAVRDGAEVERVKSLSSPYITT